MTMRGSDRLHRTMTSDASASRSTVRPRLTSHASAGSGSRSPFGEKTIAWAAATISSDRRRFVDQHDRNAVSHRVSQSAPRTHERRLFLAILEITAAFRAHEYVEQFLRQRHYLSSFGS